MVGRLIEADVLRQNIAQGIGNDQGGNLPSFKLGYDEGLADAIGTIDDMPTVDAIPVEWLKKKYQLHGVAGTAMYFRNAYAVKEILDEWEKECSDRK